LNIRPPGVKENFDDCDVITKADILAYEQIREHEEAEEMAAMAGVTATKG
jgi:hypothetical protein